MSLALWFGLFGGPAAWSIQTLVDLPPAAHGCFPRLVPLDSPVTSVRGIAFAVSIGALAVGAAATVVAMRSWASGRHFHREPVLSVLGHSAHTSRERSNVNSKCRWGGAILLVIGAAACGGGGGGGNQGAGASATATPAAPPAGQPGAAPGAPGAAAAGAPITGKTVDVQMLGDANGYHYNPAAITISPGDGVRWTMVSGGPHNVTFWPDSIPQGAQAVLNANMPTPMSPLTSPLLVNPNQTYTISFAGAPKGVYHFYCTPHLAMGMKGTITVQ